MTTIKEILDMKHELRAALREKQEARVLCVEIDKATSVLCSYFTNGKLEHLEVLKWLCDSHSYHYVGSIASALGMERSMAQWIVYRLKSDGLILKQRSKWVGRWPQYCIKEAAESAIKQFIEKE